MRVEIRQLHERLGTTTIYVTHDQIEAMTMADKIVLMRGGKIEQSGTPDELFDRPASTYAADFIGTPSINLVEGTILEGPMLGLGEMRIPLAPEAATHIGRDVTCGLRPSDLVLAPNGPIQGRVVLTEKTGVDQNIHLDIGGDDFVMTATRDTAITQGETVAIDIPPAKVHVFDRQTGQRI